MNFYKAADVLSEVSSQTLIDGYLVECNAVPFEKRVHYTKPRSRLGIKPLPKVPLLLRNSYVS